MRKAIAVWLTAGLPLLADSVAATRAWVSNRVSEARAEWRGDVASATNPVPSWISAAEGRAEGRLGAATNAVAGWIEGATNGLPGLVASSTNAVMEEVNAATGSLWTAIGDIRGVTADIGALAGTNDLPTKVSQLENDAGYLTNHVDVSGFALAAGIFPDWSSRGTWSEGGFCTWKGVVYRFTGVGDPSAQPDVSPASWAVSDVGTAIAEARSDMSSLTNPVPSWIAAATNGLPESIAAATNGLPERIAASTNGLPESIAAATNPVPSWIAAATGGVPARVSALVQSMVSGLDGKAATRLVSVDGSRWIDGTGAVWRVDRVVAWNGETSGAAEHVDLGVGVTTDVFEAEGWYCGHIAYTSVTGSWYLVRYLDGAKRLTVQYDGHGLPGGDGQYGLQATGVALDGSPVEPGQVTDGGWYQISDGTNLYYVSPLVTTVTVTRVTNAVDRLATRNASITTNDVCSIVTNEVSELTEWTFSGDLDANATYELDMAVYELNGLWWCDVFIWGSTQTQPERYRVYDVIVLDVTYEEANQAAESTMEVSGAIYDRYEDVDAGFMTATRRRVVRNALGLSRLADVPTNNVQLSNGSGYATSNDVVELIGEHGGGGDWQLVTNAYAAATNALTRKEAEAGFTEWTPNIAFLVVLWDDEYHGWYFANRSTGDRASETVGNADSTYIETEGMTASRTRLPTMADLALKADKGEMSVTPGTGADADKTTIQLKAGTDATVLTQHQQLQARFTDWVFAAEDGLSLPSDLRLILTDEGWVPASDSYGYPLGAGQPQGDGSSTTLTWSLGSSPFNGFSATRTMTGYVLGGQTTKPLQPQGNYLTEHQSLAGLMPMYALGAEPTVAQSVSVPAACFPIVYTLEGESSSVTVTAADADDLTITRVVVGGGTALYSITHDGRAIFLASDQGVFADAISNTITFDGNTPTVDSTSVLDIKNILTVSPYTSATYTATSTAVAFEIAVGALPTGVTGKARDCVLVIDCTATGAAAPTVTWPSSFHPRVDAATDFAIVEAGKRAVFYISEYAPGEFAVGGWTETEGGNAQSGGGGT